MKRMVIENLSDVLDSVGEFSYKKNASLNMIYYQISKKIIEYRKVNKLSQKKLAGILGIGQSMVSKLESGEYNFTIEQLWKISIKLGWKLTVNIDDTYENKNVLPENIMADFIQTPLQPYSFDPNSPYGHSENYDVKKLAYLQVA